ncbi:unnamed protein product [Clonostachys solani]|uniref:F-box domain-containing protein n=1 Tax=Clonostachys solani TaxID=160281 RepID=A0A9N9Z8K2_9HYPO|nr:unnamed protein product [Clonostachys solani]
MLPPEIWSRVFSELVLPATSNGSRRPLRPLYSLCLVSRQFRQIAQPLLHRTISFGYRHVGHPMLVRTLFGSPELARAVRKVALRDDDLASLASHRQLLEDTIRSLHAPEAFRHQLENSLKAPDRGSFAAIVLAMTTAVREIDIALNLEDGMAAPDLLSLLAGSNNIADDENSQSQTEYRNFGLPSLKRMSLTVGDEMCCSISGLESVLLRPGLEQLCLKKVYWHLNEGDARQWPEGTSDLPSLTLDDSMVSGHSIQDIFTRFPNLRVFNFIASDRFSGRQEDYDEEDDGEWGFRAAEVGYSLRRFGTKLEALTLRTAYYREGVMWDGSLWDDSLLGSLREMDALRKLEIDLSELTENLQDEDSAEWARNMVEILPPSLEELIVPYHYTLFGKVFEIIKGNYFPALRLIAILPVRGETEYIPSIKDEEIPGWAFILGGVGISSTLEAFYSFQRKS